MFWWGVVTTLIFFLGCKWLKKNFYRKFLSPYRKLKVKIDDIVLSTKAIQHPENLDGLRKICEEKNRIFIEEYLRREEGIKIVSSLANSPVFIIRLKLIGKIYPSGADYGTAFNYDLWKKILIVVTDIKGQVKVQNIWSFVTMEHLSFQTLSSIKSIFETEKWERKKKKK
ncbi:hypothetical protein K9L27_02735 [Candidatus Gracilibacteria bacterium]|nr:hypothetical protein [Candidatus Gracilibacteria bacterium]